MRIIVLMAILLGNVAFANDEWFGCVERKIREECEECSKSKSPADMMKWFEELTIKYDKKNVQRDKSGALQSMEIVKSPGSEAGEEIHYFFKDKKKCDLVCGKRRTDLDIAAKAKKTQEDKKFDEYK
jgi:hypothetical protein